MEHSLIDMEKLASLGRMTAVVAHEINNPLTIIELSIKQLEKDLKKGNLDIDNFTTRLSRISTASKRMSKFIRGLKTTSRCNIEDNLVNIDLEEFIKESFALINAQYIDNDVKITIKNIPNIKFQCRPDQIFQIISNLINNAYDAIEKLDEKWIELDIKTDLGKNKINFSVKDSGNGITDSVAKNILSPFFTKKKSVREPVWVYQFQKRLQKCITVNCTYKKKIKIPVLF